VRRVTPTPRFERGQTLSFWLFGVLISLVLTFFVMNYTNTIRWHVRAQNAADTAAMASVSADANVGNQRTMAMYAVAINEYRLRSIVQSMTNAANSVGGCLPTADDTGYDCDNAYDLQPAFYDKAFKKYKDSVDYLRRINAAPPPSGVLDSNGKPMAVNSATNGSAGAAFTLAASNTNCWNQGTWTNKVFDCAFGYNANFAKGATGSITSVDVVTCRDVSATANLIFSGRTSFRATGRAAAALRAVVDPDFTPGLTADPGATPNPATGQKPMYQPIESCPPDIKGDGSKPCSMDQGWLDAKAYVVDYAGLRVATTFYVPVPTSPVGPAPAALPCNKG